MANMFKTIKMTHQVVLDTVKNDEGVNVWRASSSTLALYADAQDPDAAVSALEQAIREKERDENSRLRAIKYRPGVGHEVDEEGKEITAAEATQTKQAATDEGQVATESDGETGQAPEGEPGTERASEESDPESGEEDRGSALAVEVADKSTSMERLREIAEIIGVEHEGLTKVPLRETLCDMLGVEED